MCRIIPFIFFIIVMASIAFGSIINVPADQPTIQAGINAAVNGDTVLVADSTYYENINFKGKAITVASWFLVDGDTNHIANTIIDGSQPSHPDSGSVVTFNSGEDTTSVLCGFTITGGTGTISAPNIARGGGGITCGNAGATICNNHIENNSVSNYSVVFGGGILTGPPNSNNWIIIDSNIIRSNSCLEGTVNSEGGGVLLVIKAVVRNNIIKDNIASSTTGESFGGGLVSLLTNDSIFILNNRIVNNKALTNSSSHDGLGGGLVFFLDSTAYIRIIGNVIAGNEVRSQWRSLAAGVGFSSTGGDVLFANNLVYNNYYSGVEYCRGGGLYQRSSEIRIINNTITGNSASYGGGFCNRYGDSVILVNNIFWANSASIAGPEFDMWEGNPPEVVYCDVMGGWLGVGNINLDPMFIDPSNQWFCLHEQSPCADSGDVNILDPEDPFNIGYALWPARGTIRSDMGAFGGPYACNWDPIITRLEKKTPDGELIPSTIKLFQNYPNPFNPSTTIEFSLLQTGYVTLKIYNILGEEVATLVSDRLTAGKYKYDWDASGLASGVYLYCLEAGAFKQTKKLILLK